MRKRRWTVMIVPHGSEATRSYEVDERTLRAARSAAGVVAVLAVLGIGALTLPFTPLGGRSSLAFAAPNGGFVHPSASAAAKLRALQDTLESLTRRDEQLRMMAGLPASDSMGLSSATDGYTEPVASLDNSPDGSERVRRSVNATDIDGMISRANVLAASFAVISDTVRGHVAKLENTPSVMPTAGWLTSHFTMSRFHPILHISRPHEGIDVSAPMGAPIVAPAAGIVARVAVENGYGNVLEIDHGNGIVTKYAHCSRILVRPGQRVTRGQRIAAVGNTGLSTGPHLHYEIHKDGRVVDPLTYVLPGAIPD